MQTPTPNTPGIYLIRNLLNGKVYVGSAAEVNRRRQWHLRHLRRNTHHNRHLQRAFNRYGVDAFAFEIVEVVEDVFWLRPREQAWLLRLNAHHPTRGYNRLVDAFSGHISLEHREHHSRRTAEGMATASVREKLRKGQRARWDDPIKHAEGVAAKNVPAYKQLRSELMATRLADPVKRERLLAASHSPEATKKRVDSLILANQDPALQHKKSSSQLARRARERAETPQEVLEERAKKRLATRNRGQQRRRAQAKRERAING